MTIEIMHVLQVTNFWKLTKWPLVTARKVCCLHQENLWPSSTILCIFQTSIFRNFKACCSVFIGAYNYVTLSPLLCKPLTYITVKKYLVKKGGFNISENNRKQLRGNLVKEKNDPTCVLINIFGRVYQDGFQVDTEGLNIWNYLLQEKIALKNI